jgi:putative ABC transport system substrate-binding protein
MTTRREALGALAAALAARPLATGAQTARRIPRVGILSTVDLGADGDNLREALQQRGYIDGASVMLLWRSAEGGGSERVAELVAELVRLKVDAIVTVGSSATLAAKKATTTTPIVFEVGDAIGGGFVQSLARPGGNLTGISTQISDLAPKCLQLLKEVRPDLSELTVLYSSRNISAETFLREAKSAAPALRLTIQPVATAGVTDLDAALAAIERSGSRAMVVLDSEDDRVAAFAIRNRTVTLGMRQLGNHGLLISYGVTNVQVNRYLADYVDRILKGAKPGDLPVQQPTKLELAINLKTAKAIGIAIPQQLLLRADEVIQ